LSNPDFFGLLIYVCAMTHSVCTMRCAHTAAAPADSLTLVVTLLIFTGLF